MLKEDFDQIMEGFLQIIYSEEVLNKTIFTHKTEWVTIVVMVTCVVLINMYSNFLL